LLDELVQKGQLGMKSGCGFYDWHKREPGTLIEARDRQIARELKRLLQVGKQEPPKTEA
jgi:3-hydroxyacyl-CoA dehydrogenase